MQHFILFLKGLIIGIGKIIPGVSGSVLALSLGVYEEALKRIENFFSDLKRNILYLFPLGIGIIVAILLGSNIILYCLDKYYIFTMTIFIGLIVGSIPEIMKSHSLKNKDYFFIFLIIIILYFIYTKIQLQEFIPSHNITTYFYLVFLGFVDAFTMIMPGISGTATYMVLGSYKFILQLFANPFGELLYCFCFGIGLVLGVIIMIKVVNYCFRKYAHQTWVIIISFLISSVLFMFLKTINFINQDNILQVVLLFIFSYFLMNSLEN